MNEQISTPDTQQGFFFKATEVNEETLFISPFLARFSFDTINFALDLSPLMTWLPLRLSGNNAGCDGDCSSPTANLINVFLGYF